MKPIFITLLVLVTVVPSWGQSLTNKKWIVAEYGISDRVDYGTHPGTKALAVFFNKDSVKNVIDYSKIEFLFFDDSTYTGKNQSGKTYTGKWQLDSTGHKLKVDTTVYYRFDFINPNNCITKNMKTQVTDTLGTIDTLYTFITLTGTDISTGTDIIEDNHKAVVYPVPASDYINIQFNHIVKAKEARMYNVYGQSINILLLNGEKDLYRLEVKTLVPGYYILEVIDNSGKRIAMNGVVKQ